MTGLPSESPTFSIVSFQTGKTQDYWAHCKDLWTTWGPHSGELEVNTQDLYVYNSSYLLSFLSFGDRKLFEPEEPFSGPLYRPHGRFPRPYPTTSPTRFGPKKKLLQHPRRTPKDKRRRVGGFRTSFIPHPDSIAGKGNGDVYRTDDFWNCLNENERGVIQMFKTQAFHRLGHPWVCKKLPHQAKRTQELSIFAKIREGWRYQIIFNPKICIADSGPL